MPWRFELSDEGKAYAAELQRIGAAAIDSLRKYLATHDESERAQCFPQAFRVGFERGSAWREEQQLPALAYAAVDLADALGWWEDPKPNEEIARAWRPMIERVRDLVRSVGPTQANADKLARYEHALERLAAGAISPANTAHPLTALGRVARRVREGATIEQALALLESDSEAAMLEQAHGSHG